MSLHWIECGRLNRRDINWSCDTCQKSDDSEDDNNDIKNDNDKDNRDNDHDSDSDSNHSRWDSVLKNDSVGLSPKLYSYVK